MPTPAPPTLPPAPPTQRRGFAVSPPQPHSVPPASGPSHLPSGGHGAPGPVGGQTPHNQPAPQHPPNRAPAPGGSHVPNQPTHGGAPPPPSMPRPPPAQPAITPKPGQDTSHTGGQGKAPAPSTQKSAVQPPGKPAVLPQPRAPGGHGTVDVTPSVPKPSKPQPAIIPKPPPPASRTGGQGPSGKTPAPSTQKPTVQPPGKPTVLPQPRAPGKGNNASPGLRVPPPNIAPKPPKQPTTPGKNDALMNTKDKKGFGDYLNSFASAAKKALPDELKQVASDKVHAVVGAVATRVTNAAKDKAASEANEILGKMGAIAKDHGIPLEGVLKDAGILPGAPAPEPEATGDEVTTMPVDEGNGEEQEEHEDAPEHEPAADGQEEEAGENEQGQAPAAGDSADEGLVTPPASPDVPVHALDGNASDEEAVML